MRLPDGSGFHVVELTDKKDHPLRQQATPCTECQVEAVMFNPGNVDVLCHACGTRETDIDIRQFHLSVWFGACNSHEELLAACEAALDFVGRQPESDEGKELYAMLARVLTKVEEQ